MGIIELKNVDKGYNGIPLFQSVNLNLHKGMTYGFVGPNGSGKSVLFKMICGFVFPDQGLIYVNGKELNKGKNRFPQNIGLIIDRPGFIATKTGFENLKSLSIIKNKITDKDIIATMEMVGLHPEAKQKVKNYSVGMKQKLAFSQAIMEDQEILVLDEPFNGLDEDSVINARSIIKKLKSKGKTILLTSHNREDINILCDKTFKINGTSLELDSAY
ncbi:ABC transporter ATP-binding protein [Virgibacillus natechei]|uniref:ABC transporter ATP-binding protein n=1 Tax=Virgibacillus sp. CBA3643 TaxID=2942278 RepID=UPI0035A3D16C